jgi:hypothetical protein
MFLNSRVAVLSRILRYWATGCQAADQFFDQEQVVILKPDGCSVTQAGDQIAGG